MQNKNDEPHFRIRKKRELKKERERTQHNYDKIGTNGAKV